MFLFLAHLENEMGLEPLMHDKALSLRHQPVVWCFFGMEALPPACKYLYRQSDSAA